MFSASEIAFIKKLGGGSSGGGSGADLLNGVIKQEHLPEGYPYSEVSHGEILPETNVAIQDGMGFILPVFEITAGKEYVVTWNGTEYPLTAVEFSNEGMALPCLGNLEVVGGDGTGEPFLIAVNTPDMAEQQGFGALVMPLDSSTSPVVSIAGMVESITLLDEKYLPAATLPLIDISERITFQTGTDMGGNIGLPLFEKLQKAAENSAFKFKFSYYYETDEVRTTTAVVNAAITEDSDGSVYCDFAVDLLQSAFELYRFWFRFDSDGEYSCRAESVTSNA